MRSRIGQDLLLAGPQRPPAEVVVQRERGMLTPGFGLRATDLIAWYSWQHQIDAGRDQELWFGPNRALFLALDVSARIAACPSVPPKILQNNRLGPDAVDRHKRDYLHT
jgi:hypothetical protein